MARHPKPGKTRAASAAPNPSRAQSEGRKTVHLSISPKQPVAHFIRRSMFDVFHAPPGPHASPFQPIRGASPLPRSPFTPHFLNSRKTGASKTKNYQTNPFCHHELFYNHNALSPSRTKPARKTNPFYPGSAAVHQSMKPKIHSYPVAPPRYSIDFSHNRDITLKLQRKSTHSEAQNF